MQDILALAIAAAAAAWLVRTLVRRLARFTDCGLARCTAGGPARPCGSASGGPAGADAFVPLERLAGAIRGPTSRPTPEDIPP